MVKTSTIQNLFYIRTLDEYVDIDFSLYEAGKDKYTLSIDINTKNHEYSLSYHINDMVIDSELPLNEEFTHINIELKEKCLLFAVAYAHKLREEELSVLEELISQKIDEVNEEDA